MGASTLLFSLVFNITTAFYPSKAIDEYLAEKPLFEYSWYVNGARNDLKKITYIDTDPDERKLRDFEQCYNSALKNSSDGIRNGLLKSCLVEANEHYLPQGYWPQIEHNSKTSIPDERIDLQQIDGYILLSVINESNTEIIPIVWKQDSNNRLVIELADEMFFPTQWDPSYLAAVEKALLDQTLSADKSKALEWFQDRLLEQANTHYTEQLLETYMAVSRGEATMADIQKVSKQAQQILGPHNLLCSTTQTEPYNIQETTTYPLPKDFFTAAEIAQVGEVVVYDVPYIKNSHAFAEAGLVVKETNTYLPTVSCQYEDKAVTIPSTPEILLNNEATHVVNGVLYADTCLKYFASAINKEDLENKFISLFPDHATDAAQSVFDQIWSRSNNVNVSAIFLFLALDELDSDRASMQTDASYYLPYLLHQQYIESEANQNYALVQAILAGILKTYKCNIKAIQSIPAGIGIAGVSLPFTKGEAQELSEEFISICKFIKENIKKL